MTRNSYNNNNYYYYYYCYNSNNNNYLGLTKLQLFVNKNMSLKHYNNRYKQQKGTLKNC